LELGRVNMEELLAVTTPLRRSALELAVGLVRKDAR
jgi:hypothetical protein